MTQDSTNPKTAVIIGAGPAGLTAALELQKHSDIRPVMIERTDYIGGLARTVNYKGNRIDIGGHRFFSKSDRVMQWWLDIMPMQTGVEAGEQLITYRGRTTTVSGPSEPPDPEKTDRVMLVRNRKSRIYFMRKFFAYPISLSLDTLANFGLTKTLKVGFSYVKSSVLPIKPERTLEEFLTNRFGKELYATFFKSYTEKVWGAPCDKISAAWGAQRVKGLSLWKALYHFVTRPLRGGDVSQKGTETSLIERFLYPKLGPGQMWEYVASQVKEQGGEIIMETSLNNIFFEGNRVKAIEVVNEKTKETQIIGGDYFFSTMPMRDLVRAMRVDVPPKIKEISEGLVYRDFITVGLLVKKMALSEESDKGKQLITDNWIYIQEPDVKLGRLQIFNNWSPYLVADPTKVWLGLEYFCNDTDDMWSWDDQKMIAFAGAELEKIGMIDAADIEDSTVIRMPKTYPGYFGTYDRFEELRKWIDQFENLFLIGRNGMHKYNNQDHSMLTAMVAVENIINGVKDKENLWAVNTEEEYHEEKQTESAQMLAKRAAAILAASFLMFLVLYGCCITGLVLKEPDICFLLGGGRWIVEHGQIPATDPFSYTTHYHWAQYVIEKWLTEVIFYLVQSRLGTVGLLLFDAMILTLAFVVMPLRILWRGGWRGTPALGLTLLATLTSCSHLAVRPEIFSFLFTGIWLEVLIIVTENARRNQSPKQQIDWRYIALLAVLMCLWSNMHTLFLAGILLPAMYSGCIVLERFLPGLKDKPINWTVPIMVLVCLGASLINPYGIGLWTYMPNVFGPFNNTNNEMQPIKLATAANPFFFPFYGLILIGISGIIQSWKKPWRQGDLFFRALIPVGAAAGFKTVRSVPLADLFLVGGNAETHQKELEQAPEIPQTASFKTELSNELSALISPFKWQWPISCVIATLVGAWLTTYSVPPEIPQPSKAFEPPTKAIAFIEKARPKGNLLNDPHFGATMIWQMHPNPPVFIDPRYNLYGDPLLQDYWRMVQCRDDWKGLLTKYDISWVFLPPDLELSKRLAGDGQWRLLYSDQASVIYERNVRKLESSRMRS